MRIGFSENPGVHRCAQRTQADQQYCDHKTQLFHSPSWQKTFAYTIPLPDKNIAYTTLTTTKSTTASGILFNTNLIG